MGMGMGMGVGEMPYCRSWGSDIKKERKKGSAT